MTFDFVHGSGFEDSSAHIQRHAFGDTMDHLDITPETSVLVLTAALVALEQPLDDRFMRVTHNVDALLMTRCSVCDRPPFADDDLYLGNRLPVGVETWLVNAEAPRNVDAFDHVLIGESGSVLPELLAAR